MESQFSFSFKDAAVVDKNKTEVLGLYSTSFSTLHHIPDVTIRPYYCDPNEVTISSGNSTKRNDSAPQIQRRHAEIFRVSGSPDGFNHWAEQQLQFRNAENRELFNKNRELTNQAQMLTNRVKELESVASTTKTEEKLKDLSRISAANSKIEKIRNEKLELETLFQSKCNDFEEIHIAYNKLLGERSDFKIKKRDQNQTLAKLERKCENLEAQLSAERLISRAKMDGLNQKIGKLQKTVGSLESCVSKLEVELVAEKKAKEKLQKKFYHLETEKEGIHGLLIDQAADADRVRKCYHRRIRQMEERHKAETEKIENEKEADITKLKNEQVPEKQRLYVKVKAIKNHLNQNSASCSTSAGTKRKACKLESPENEPFGDQNKAYAVFEKKGKTKQETAATEDIEVITLSDSDD